MKTTNKILFLFNLLFFAISYSQNIKVTYTYKPSETADFEENVFLNNNYKVSIVDSIPIKIYKLNNGDDIYVEKDKGIKQYRNILIDDSKNTYFTYQIKKANYLTIDNPPIIKWNLKYKETKKIGKYICKKATAIFRGTDIEAWYTIDIPVSLGPFKFKGLPGLILEVKTLGINKRLWIVKNIQYPYKGNANFSKKYIGSLKKIGIKDLVEKIDDINDEEQRILLSKVKLPQGASIGKIETVSGNAREMVENKFEWEK